MTTVYDTTTVTAAPRVGANPMTVVRDATAAVPRIGPNAITRIVDALQSLEGTASTTKIMALAQASAYLAAPPHDMVRESEVIAVHAAVREALGPQRAHTIAWIAGQRTADYLLAHRIPAAAQRALKLLPARVAGRVLLAAITRHAWTFTGSGRMRFQGWHPVRVTLADCALCRDQTAEAPTGTYYAAVFEHLFRKLVHPMTRVLETQCMAMGAPACVFEIGWGPRRAPAPIGGLTQIKADARAKDHAILAAGDGECQRNGRTGNDCCGSTSCNST
jgi:divinyl protochlorophyllide a 8-vinyl-reductase